MVVHVFNLSTEDPRQVDLCEFEASLAYVRQLMAVSNSSPGALDAASDFCGPLYARGTKVE